MVTLSSHSHKRSHMRLKYPSHSQYTWLQICNLYSVHLKYRSCSRVAMCVIMVALLKGGQRSHVAICICMLVQHEIRSNSEV